MRSLLIDRGVEATLIRPDKGESIPTSMAGADGLIVLGGPMNVSEQAKYPHLTAEIELLRRGVKGETPILGLCLGSQLLAASLGAVVKPSLVKEVGWLPIDWRDEAAEDPIFVGVERRGRVFHWHEQEFDLPVGTTWLASSAGCRHQAFRFGHNAYGFQFHWEVDVEKAGRMLDCFGDELPELGLERDEVLRQAVALENSTMIEARVALGRWIDFVAK